MSGDRDETPPANQAEPIAVAKEVNARAHEPPRRSGMLRKWVSEHKWEIIWGLVFAWLIGRFVFPPEHKPYRVQILEYKGIDEGTARHFKVLRRDWNDNPPSLGDVPVLMEITDVDDTGLEKTAEQIAEDASTLLVIGHLPTALTKRALVQFMHSNPPIPYVATTASADDLCEHCDNSKFLPWLQPSPSNTKEAESMLLFARQRGKNQCLVVTDQSALSEGYSDELANDIKKLAQSRNVRIVNTYKMGAGSLPSEEDLKKLDPDCVLYAGSADIALTLYGLLPEKYQWLLVSDGVVETDKLGELSKLPANSVFFAYATTAADAARSVYAGDAVGIARTLIGDLNRKGGSIAYRLRATFHLESVRSSRLNLDLVMQENADNRAWYACNSSWDHVCIFQRNKRENGLFHVWQVDDANQIKNELSMRDIDGWHPPEQGTPGTSMHLAGSTRQ
jgi:hypothetical protein